MAATMESFAPPDELLLELGRTMIDNGIGAADVHRYSDWGRDWLTVRDPRWADLPEDDRRRVVLRASQLAEGEALEAKLAGQVEPPERAVEERTQRQRAPLPRVWIDEATMPPQDIWLLKGLLGVRDLALVYGAPSCGKTFFAIDLVGSIVAGLGWRDRKTSPTLGVYIAAEAGRSVLRRFIAWRDRNVGDAHEARVPLAIVPRAINLMHANEVTDLIAELRDIAAEAKVPLGVVVFDTLSRSMAGGDENSAQDMTRVIAEADRIRDELAAAVILVHHTGKDSAKGARGHSALAAAADTIIAVADRVATFEKVRDGAANMAFAFDLEVVELGKDNDGDQITTCIAVPLEGAPAAAGPRAVGLGKNQDLALKVLRTLYGRIRKNLEERHEDPAGAHALTEGWITECRQRMCGKEANDPREKERFRYAWRDIRKGLLERRLIRFEGEHDAFVFLVEAAP